MNANAIIITLLVIIIIIMLYIILNLNRMREQYTIIIQGPQTEKLLNTHASMSYEMQNYGAPRQVLVKIGNIVMHSGNTFMAVRNATNIPFQIIGYPNTKYEIDKIQTSRKPFIEIVSYATTNNYGIANGVIQLKDSEDYQILFSGPGIKTAYEIHVHNLQNVQ